MSLVPLDWNWVAGGGEKRTVNHAVELFNLVTEIANMPDESNEWDGVERYRLVRAKARKLLGLPYEAHELILKEYPDENTPD